MSFLAPIMLWGTLAASIPIALHFFFRSRYRRVPWAAMTFLLASIEQTSRRLRFQELLLLMARVAFLVLLALALARPTFNNVASGTGDAVDAVVLLDTSYSMDARDGPTTRLEQARAAALSLLDQLPPHSTVQVVTCSDRASALGPRNPSDLEQAREVLQSVQVSHLATDLLPGVNEAAAILQRGQAPNKELYLFSDMQRLGWEQQGAALAERLRDVSKQASITLVRCGRRNPRNAGIVGILPQSGIPHVGERAGFAVLVRNRGTEPVRNLTISLAADGLEKERESQPLAEIGPGETRAIPLTARLTKPGLRVLSAALTHDDLEADNRFDRVIQVRDQVRVLVVDGAPDAKRPEKAASFYLLHALRPVKEDERARYPVQPSVVSPRQAAPGLLADTDLCILVNVAIQPDEQGRAEHLSPAFLAGLESFVREGHGLVVFGGDHVRPQAYNRLLDQQQHLLPARLADLPVGKEKTVFRLDRDSADAPAFRLFREDEAFKSINGVEVRRRLEVEKGSEEGEATAVLLRYSDGRPAVLGRQVGAGEVLLVTTSADPSWSSWPMRYWTYVPFLHSTLDHLLQSQAQQYNERAGNPLRWYPPEQDATRAFALFDPQGGRHRLGPPEMQNGRPVIMASLTPRAGVYRLAPADGADPVGAQTRDGEAQSVPFAVTADPHETENLDALSEEQLDERLGFRPVHMTAGEEPLPVSAERLNREWTLWLLAGVVILGLVEMGLAWLCGRAR
jgi:hypothetical protein